MTNHAHNQRGVGQPESHRAIGLFDLVGVTWRRKWYLIMCVVVALGLGLAYAYFSEPVFQVRARVLVQQQGMPLQSDRTGRGQDKDFLATQAEIIRSPAVVSRAANSLGPVMGEQTSEEYALKTMNSLTVNPVLGTNVLSVEFRTNQRDEAIGTVEAIIASYRDYVRETERASHVETLGMLTRSEKELRDDLEALQADYRELHDQSPNMGQGKRSTDVRMALLANLGQTLSETKTRRLQLENQLKSFHDAHGRRLASRHGGRSADLVVSSGATPCTEELDFQDELQLNEDDAVRLLALLPQDGPTAADDFATIRKELFTARMQAKPLEQKFGHRHPDVIAVREQIAAWETRLQEAVNSAPDLLEKELQSVKQHEEQLSQLYADEFKEVKEVDSYLLKEQQALDAVERVQSIHDSILTQLREWQLTDETIADGRSGVHVSVLEAPVLADAPVWPSKPLVLGVFAIVGLIGGMGMVLVLDRTDDTLHTSRTVGKDLHLPILGRVPRMSAPCRAAERPLFRGRMVHLKPNSAGAEAFRSLRTCVMNGAETNGVVVQIASPRSGEGKTTVAANLAFSFAQLGKKVVVVDADLRRGRLHEILKVSNASGLAAVLQDDLDVQEAIQRCPLTELDVLSRGREVTNPAELLAQPEFTAVLDRLRNQYDIVVLDTPPLLTTSEASALAAKSDRLLLNLMIGSSSLAEAQHACEQLSTLGVNVTGIVVNNTTPNANDYDVTRRGSRNGI